MTSPWMDSMLFQETVSNSIYHSSYSSPYPIYGFWFCLYATSDAPSPILASCIDPVVWREETERVAIQLRSLAASSSSSSAASQGGWGQHLTTLMTVAKSLFPAHGTEDGVVVNTKSDAKKSDTDSSIVLAQKMAQFQLYIEETVNKIQTSERILNKIESFTNLGLSYSQFKEVFETTPPFIIY